ncbi:hypothetical protein [Saccharomonospora sp.]|nr:hypothetical protein [Saccharomonospora sp.]
MLGDILTCVGATLGIAVLLAMALGPVALDYGDTRIWRTQRTDTPTR